MPKPPYDIAVIGDFRFPGGTSTAVAEELEAQHAAGYRTALIQIKGPVLKFPHAFHPRIRACLDAGHAELVHPDTHVSAGLLLAHHPTLFTYRPKRALNVHADTRLLVIWHPPLDGEANPSYDWVRIRANAEATLGDEVVWAPVGPAVRAQFESFDEAPPLTSYDWHSVVDPKVWRVPRKAFCDPRPVIGRHSRPDPLKWPDTRELTLASYPADPRFLVRVLGAGPFLHRLLGGYPRNWQTWSFNGLPARDFLGTIDFFVYFHHSHWVEAFGRVVIEAMASGAVAILPEPFRPLFGDDVLYAEPGEAPHLALGLRADLRTWRELSERGQAAVQRRFSHKAHVERLRALIGRPRRTRAQVQGVPGRPPLRVLFMSSNGVGMGHLTRALAIARRLPRPVEPVILTLSQALGVVREQGFLAEYLPYHVYLGWDFKRWNRFLHEELNELISFYGPKAFVFDGHIPYSGVIDALGDNPDLCSAWCRRGMWGRQGLDIIKRERHFDAVIEPRDIAAPYDDGPTVEHRSRTRVIDPVRLLDSDELFGRELARQKLGLSVDRPAVLLQLGAQNNYDYRAVTAIAVDRLLTRGAQVVAAEWLIAERPLELPEGVVRLSEYPIARYLHGFDFALSAVGYNSFHELVAAGVPTIFVPNEHPQQDDQLSRARYAEHHGLGFCVRAREPYRLADCIDALLVPAERQRIRERCGLLRLENGAVEAARFIEEMVYTRRADRP